MIPVCPLTTFPFTQGNIPRNRSYLLSGNSGCVFSSVEPTLLIKRGAFRLLSQCKDTKRPSLSLPVPTRQRGQSRDPGQSGLLDSLLALLQTLCVQRGGPDTCPRSIGTGAFISSAPRGRGKISPWKQRNHSRRALQLGCLTYIQHPRYSFTPLGQVRAGDLSSRLRCTM